MYSTVQYFERTLSIPLPGGNIERCNLGRGILKLGNRKMGINVKGRGKRVMKKRKEKSTNFFAKRGNTGKKGA